MSNTESVQGLRQEILALHKDCKDLATYITNARSEITDIRPDDIKQDKLPRAGKELDAIVQATESATNQIMTAAEKIMSARVTEADVVNDACMEIFEACSFQDITGQRISKVVNTLEYIESYLTKLTHAWGHEGDSAPMNEVALDADDEAHLLDGPALEGEGVDQDFIDNMFDEEAPQADFSNKENKESEPKKANEPASASDSKENIAQDDIDALFN
jgi:chemotaxis protein CheZ